VRRGHRRLLDDAPRLRQPLVRAAVPPIRRRRPCREAAPGPAVRTPPSPSPPWPEPSELPPHLPCRKASA
jgi:hypothetical protein